MLKTIFDDILFRLGIRRLRGHSFFESLLPTEPVIFDLGAHRAEFSAMLCTHFPTAKIFTVEANPALAEQLRAEGWDVRHAVLCGLVSGEGWIAFTLSENLEASSVFGTVAASFGGATCEVKVPLTDLPGVMADAGYKRVSLAKMDVEGAEIGVLFETDPAILELFDQIAVEFHDNFAPEMKPRVREVFRRLKQIGFWKMNANWPFTDDVLFVNARSAGPGYRWRILAANTLYVLRGAFFCFVRTIKGTKLE